MLNPWLCADDVEDAFIDYQRSLMAAAEEAGLHNGVPVHSVPRHRADMMHVGQIKKELGCQEYVAKNVRHSLTAFHQIPVEDHALHAQAPD